MSVPTINILGYYIGNNIIQPDSVNDSFLYIVKCDVSEVAILSLTNVVIQWFL